MYLHRSVPPFYTKETFPVRCHSFNVVHFFLKPFDYDSQFRHHSARITLLIIHLILFQKFGTRPVPVSLLFAIMPAHSSSC